MSLTKEWFDQRDHFIATQTELGHLTLDSALEALSVTSRYFFDLGILTQRDLSTTSMNLTQLTVLGGLFFIEQNQQIFITPDNLIKLKQSLENWDDFTLQNPLAESDVVATIAVRNQRTVTLTVSGGEYRHHLRFQVKQIQSKMERLMGNDDSAQLLNIWNNFIECVNIIENQPLSTTNVDIATNEELISHICSPWHALIKRHFRSQMHQIGFEHNLATLKAHIKQAYSQPNTKWLPCNQYFELVRPERDALIDSGLVNEEGEMDVRLLLPKSINPFGIVEPQKIELSKRKVRSQNSCILVNPGDILLYKGGDRENIKVAYYPADYPQQEIYCQGIFSVLRAKEGSNWDGKRLFLFLASQVGKTLLEFTLKHFSVNGLAHYRIFPSDLRKLELPDLSQVKSHYLDNKYNHLIQLLEQRQSIEQQIDDVLEK
ncbi:hypothetical protein [Vibrio rarus]|uniref:hypothetical protein n=1 Tax=Vibrio rarus TaxID=413403 RepID=UPI0021C4467B|nr:hypothetical protein [Vibrio rarus]